MINDLFHYQQWRGTLKTSGLRVGPIFRLGWQLVLKRKYSKMLFIFAAITPLFFLFAVYVTSKSELKVIFQFPMFHNVQNFAFIIENFFKSMIFFLLLLTTAFGSNLIAGEYRSRALPLYFSRPIAHIDYLLGKFAVIGLINLAYSLLPALLLLLVNLVFKGEVGIGLFNLLGIFIVSLIYTLFFSSYVLLISIFFRKVSLTEIFAFFSFYALTIIAEILYNSLNNGLFLLISPRENLKVIATFFFSKEYEVDFSPLYSFLIVCGFVFFAVWGIYYLLRKKELEQ